MNGEDHATPAEGPYVAFDDDTADDFVIDGDEVSIGRTAENGLRLSDPEVSRQHARFLRNGDTVALEDLGSSNGTFVNGAPITGEVVLHDGDRLAFAGVTATFHDGAGRQLEPAPEAMREVGPMLPLAALEGFGIPPVLLAAEETSLGRAIDNDVVLEDAAVSAHHAAIRRRGQDFLLADLGSVNGTHLNGKQIAGAPVLRPGDEIRIGDTVVIFRRLAPYRRGGPGGRIP